MMGKDDFKITREEFNKFKDAMKKDEFKKLFFDYLDEISDPKNRQKYEEEIALLEKERGNNIRWVKPEGQFVVKTKYDKNQKKTPLIQSPQRQKTIDMSDGNSSFARLEIKPGMKVFINICQSPEIKDAMLQKSNVTKNNARGQNWSIPYSLTYGRNDKDKANNECVVYDCIFSPNTIRMSSNYRFKELIIMTAIEGVERQFNVKLEKKYKIPKMKCKGTPQDTVIREKSKEEVKGETSQEFIERLYKENKNSEKEKSSSSSSSSSSLKDTKISNDHNHNKDINKNNNKTNVNSATNKNVNKKEEQKKKPLIEEIGENESIPKIETPKYKIVHRGEIQISNFVNDRQHTHNNRPTSLLITIDLPNMVRQSEADLEISENMLDLYVKDKYKLNIKLPYEIIEDEGTATFDRKNRKLVLNLPVVPQKELLVETSNDDNVPIEVIDEKGNPIKDEDINKTTNFTLEENQSSIDNDDHNDKEKDRREGGGDEGDEKNEKKVKEKEKDEEVDYTKKITDYAVVFYENSKIPKAKIHQTKEQLEILLYIPEVILSTISTKFLGNTFYLEAQSQQDHQLYQYLIKLADQVNIEECGFMVVDAPKEEEEEEEESRKSKSKGKGKEEEKEKENKSGIPETVKAVKCLIHKKKFEWWSNNVFEIRPKLTTTTTTTTENTTINTSMDTLTNHQQEKEKENKEENREENDHDNEKDHVNDNDNANDNANDIDNANNNANDNGKDNSNIPTPEKKKFKDYIYKDGETDTELFEFKEKIFLTELFVNKLDDYLTKQEKQPKSKKENNEMPDWLREAIHPSSSSKKKKENGNGDSSNKVIELTEDQLTATTTTGKDKGNENENENKTTTTEASSEATNHASDKVTEPEITLESNAMIFDLDDIYF
jgi:hypothetical protein